MHLPEDIVAHLGAVQAQDYHGALWGIALRLPAATRADVEDAIARRAIVRTWPMRGTLHFVPAADARWMLELLAPRVIRSTSALLRQLELDAATFKRGRTVVAKALRKQSVLTRREVYSVLEAAGITTTGLRGIHIVRQLSLECVLCHGPHADKQPTFALFDEWIAESNRFDRDDALRALAERFFTGHGPATVRDFVWWSGLTVADAKVGLHLASASLVRVEHDDTEYWITPQVTEAEPAAYLLPDYDEFLLGYKDRTASLDPRHSILVVPGANGVFANTLVLDGRVRGTWKRVAGKHGVTVEASPFGRLSAAEKKAFVVPAERFAQFLGVPVTVRWAARR